MTKYFYSFLVTLCYFAAATAQTTITIGTGAALTADYHSGPIYRSSSVSAYDFSQYAYLYTAAELSTIAAGSLINKIAWNKTNTGATVSGAKCKIYLKNSSQTAYNSDTYFSTLITDASLVYDNSNTIIPATTGFVEFALSNPFVYSGGGIEIMVDWDISSVSGDPVTDAFNWQKTTVASKILGTANSTTITRLLSTTTNSIGTLTNTRPVVQISFGAALPPCTGTPTAGNVIAPDSICTAAIFTLGLNDVTTGVSGINFQWQSSSDSSTWQNVAGGITESITSTQAAATWYRCIVKCAHADTTQAKLVKLKQSYQCTCTPASTNCNYSDVITNVNFATINHSSGCTAGGYTDYSDSVAAPLINQATTVPIAVTVGPGGTEYVAAWIDYNHNGLFEAFEYTAIGSGNGITINGAISIPDGIVNGITKMRIRVKYNSMLNSTDYCTTYSYGETEDYLVNIGPSVPCSGVPLGGVTTAGSLLVCTTDSALLQVNNASTGVSGLSYQWQLSKDSISWTDIAGKTAATVIVYQDTVYFYRRSITCGLNISYSLPVKIRMQDSLLCYCRTDSAGCAVSGNISNVNFAGISNSSNCTPRGYSNYTNSVAPAIAQAGVTLPISLTTMSSTTSLTTYFYVWIDYNHSGTFDSTEYNFVGAISGPGTVSNTIYIPADADTGITGIRIRSKFNYSPVVSFNDACTALPTSETEDYLIHITAPTSCNQGFTAGVISGPADICDGFPIELNNINATPAADRYAWQSSVDSLHWTNINNTGYWNHSIVAQQSVATWYRMVDSCNNGNTAVSNMIKIAMKSNSILCHCVPPGTSVCTIGDIIGRLTFGTIDTTTYCSTTGYSDFVAGSNQTTTINNNTGVPMTAKVGCSVGDPEWVGVWIDFNQNGVFERSEFTLLGYGCGNTVAGTVSIPSNAVTGYARMRVRVTADERFTPSDACKHFPNGETEDYKVYISSTGCTVYRWLGTVSNAWENPANWNCGMVPGTHSYVVIESGNVEINSNVVVYSLNVSPAATVTVVPTYNLVITH